MSRIRWFGPTLLLMVTLVLSMLVGPEMVRQIARSYEKARIEQVRRDLADNPTLSTMSEAFKDVATVVRPSVTSITLLERDSSNSRLKNSGNGSGWVYRHYNDFQSDPNDYDDYIITNHHVVANVLLGRAEQVVVRFDDGGEYRASIVGTDPKSDVAVLKIRQNDLIPAALATEPAEQGEIVFAVGSPFQFDFSMSQGIVSATGRKLNDLRLNSYENFIQTDAAINPGNSGGPLTNVRGEVIGMNTAIAIDGAPETNFSGLGFAIPIDQVVHVADELIEHGEVKRGYIGVSITDVDFATRRELGFEGRGVLCMPVPGEPADLAGMQLGDIITHVDDKEVTTTEALRIAVSNRTPGSTIPIRIWRQGRKLTLKITLAENRLESGFSFGRPNIDEGVEPGELRPAWDLGLNRMESLTPSFAITTQGWAYTPGVLVRMIERNSLAERAGIARMSVITAVDAEPIHDLASLALAMQSIEGDTMTLTIKRWNPSGEGSYDEREVEFEMDAE